MFKEYKEFILRGNVVDLAVAVVIGAAFGAVVTSFVRDLLTPMIAAIGGQPDFSAIAFTVNGSRFRIGEFINALLSFLIVATAVFFLVILPVNRLRELRLRGQGTPDPTTRQCPQCLSEIPVAAIRCAHCAQEVPPASAAAK